MRQLLRKLLMPFFIWLAEKFSAAPKQADVFRSLSRLYKTIITKESSLGIVIPFDPLTNQFIILSDQHKGTRAFDDDFLNNEPNYTAALQYYYKQGYHFINLGDAEELWKNKADEVLASYPAALKAEASFQATNKYFRTFGNHDLLWKNSLDVKLYLRNIFQIPLPVYEGIVLRTTGNDQTSLDIFCTHGHQGDKMSDNNAFSTWVIAHIWAPVQRFLQLNINTPANDFTLRNKHNRLMYEWSSRKKGMLLITGHTHKPVFASGRYASAVVHGIHTAADTSSLYPTYFNTGCCCYNDGDITGIEIADGYIRLIKWFRDNETPKRIILEEKQIIQLIQDMKAIK